MAVVHRRPAESPRVSVSDLPLVVAGVEKRLPNGRVLYRDLDLSIARGEFVAVMGESGIGKSTLLNLVAGLDAVTAGSVRFEGHDLATLDDDARTTLRRDRMGFVFQAFHVLPHLSVVQNVALPLVLQRVGRADAVRRATAMLDAVGLAGRGPDFPAVLSGGELQRVAIARALVHAPSLLLLDEPTGNLDPETAVRILDVIDERRRASGAAALLVTHSEVAAGRADRLLTLKAEGLVPR
jgi:putative ABC transport system ATP-binding protein